MSKYSIDTIKISDAQKFWDKSPHSTIFTNPKFLSYFKYDIYWWKALKGNETICIWPVCLENKSKIVLPDFSYYFGPLWFKDFFQIPNHSWLALSKSIYELFINKFINEYEAVVAQLPIGLTDVRIFDWWNYNLEEQKRFIIKPRYTAIIEDVNKLSEDKIKANFRYWRRNELKKIHKDINKLTVSNEYNLDEILKLYSSTTNIKNIISTRTRHSIEIMLNLVKNNFGDLIIYREKDTKQIASLILILYGKKEANVILNLTSDKWKNSGLSALNILQGIKFTQKRKINFFDFNGANSPNRGDDKHSYGAKHELFFEISYDRAVYK